MAPHQQIRSPSLSNLSLPPGFDQLSEEEQMKIMAVMQCAEMDAALDSALTTTHAMVPVDLAPSAPMAGVVP